MVILINRVVSALAAFHQLFGGASEIQFAVTVEVALRVKSQFFNGVFYAYSRFGHFFEYPLVLLFQHPLFGSHPEHLVEFGKEAASSQVRQ